MTTLANQPEFYRPTQGEEIGTWNVFPRTGGAVHSVPFDQLPIEVQGYVLQYQTRRLADSFSPTSWSVKL